jgi:alpha-L-fucosidase
VDGNGASWPVFNKKVSKEDYMKQREKFTAKNYDPKQWASLIKESGAKYAVLTTKHHDGMALWNTKANNLNVVKKTPAKRDLVESYAEAIRSEGIKVGFYFSWLDWSNDDYGTLGKMYKTDKSKKKPDSMKKWNNFLKSNDTQLKELSAFKPDLFWFDGDWGMPDGYWHMDEMRVKLKKWNPEIILNERMGDYGDYETAEQGVPFKKRDNAWELCMTMSPGWGYSKQIQTKISNHISANKLIQILAETSSMGGNLLLNISPKPDGTIPEWQVENLKEIGKWLRLNGAAIYGSKAGINKNHYGAPSTLSKDGKTLYLFVFSKPINEIMIKGFQNTPKSITVLGADNSELKMKGVGGAAWKKVPPTSFITFPDTIDIGLGRVIKIEFNEKIDLYTGKSGAIEQN